MKAALRMLGREDRRSGSVYNLVQAEELNHHVEVEKGILERQCQALIQDFFKEKRLRKS